MPFFFAGDVLDGEDTAGGSGRFLARTLARMTRGGDVVGSAAVTGGFEATGGGARDVDGEGGAVAEDEDIVKLGSSLLICK